MFDYQDAVFAVVVAVFLKSFIIVRTHRRKWNGYAIEMQKSSHFCTATAIFPTHGGTETQRPCYMWQYDITYEMVAYSPCMQMMWWT